MAREWTGEQKKVIDFRGGNLLVSAAAGSGKTAVLVERILKLVTDPEDQRDIDRLLVLTFTRAAAGEMRERLSDELEKRLAENPDDRHLQEQSVLVGHAHITTIHGFCAWIIQNYYQRIGLDPGYRIGEEGELLLMQADVMDEMLEEEYRDPSDGFLDFIEAYAPGRDDSAAGKLILSVYEFAMSHPDPEDWLDRCCEVCNVENAGDLDSSMWMKTVLEDTRLRIEGERRKSEENLRSALAAGVGAEYAGTIRDDIEKLSQAEKAGSFPEMRSVLGKLVSGSREEKFRTWPPLTKKKKEGMTPEKIAAVEGLKKSRPSEAVRKLAKEYYSGSTEQIIADLNGMRPYMNELVRLVLRFRELFSAEKIKKNILDYSDLEHFALKILVEKGGDGSFVRTGAAEEISRQFDEVMTDEYQDSNYLQETILEAVSGGADGRYDRFMVGDMKQSIYGFRMARPGIFLEKYRSYGQASEAAAVEFAGTRIDLTKNFRSRPEVTRTVNAFFERLMIPELGGIRYDDSQALHAGASYYPPSPDPSFPKSEFMIINRENPDFAEYNTRTGRMQLEASAVGSKIRGMVGREYVYDRKTGKERPLEYGDCAVLLRTVSGWSETFVRTLQDMGIPAYAASKKGYFSSIEVDTVLNYLKITDNPKQDIPMAAVLHSPIGGFSDEDLARIRAAAPGVTFFDAVRQFACNNSGDPDDEELGIKVASFLGELESFRERAPFTPVHEMIQAILDETGYGVYAAAMPAGEQREANLRALVEKAAAYEKTSYHGVFNFIRYIERLKKYSADEGEVNIYGESGNIVRVMSIHSAKGLEFPVVFVSGLSKQFNQTDERSRVVMHADLGIGMQLVDLDSRTKKDTVLRSAVRKKLEQDNKGEELRVLYVAMTRAAEKLILTGVVENEEAADEIRRHQYEQDMLRKNLPEGQPFVRKPAGYESLIKAKSYMDWIALSVPEEAVLTIREISADDIAAPEVIERKRIADAVETVERDSRIKGADEFLDRVDASESLRAGAVLDFLKRRDSFVYPYSRAASVPAKMTVTELKERYMPAESGTDAGIRGAELFPEETVTPYIPEFMRKKEEEAPERGAARGVIYHRFLQCVKYGEIPDPGGEGSAADIDAAVGMQLESMVKHGILAEYEAGVVNIRDMTAFLLSDIGRRMREASLAGTLRREQPFVLDVSAKDIDSAFPAGENILVQGTIDAFFTDLDTGSIVLVDYKTDYVEGGDGRPLADKYAVQFKYYKMALERITGKKVTEMWLYSFGLRRAVRML